MLEALFRRHSCKGHTVAASLICPKEVTLKATTFKIQIVAVLPLELLLSMQGLKYWEGRGGKEVIEVLYLNQNMQDQREKDNSEQEEAVA